MPENGWTGEEIASALADLRKRDVQWEDGRVQGWVYYPGDEAVDIALDAMKAFYSTNPLLAARGFPSLVQIRSDLLAIAAELLNAPTASGVLTTGGSESNLLGVWTALRRARDTGCAGSPNMVVPYSAHPSFNKAGMFFGVEVRRVPLADDFRADLGAVANAIDDDTVLLVGSAPDYSHGIIDPIEELGRLALDAGVPLHIDSCVGGFVLPFLERIGRPAATWDFRVPGVASISADIHKHGYGPKGVSVLMTDSDERAALTRFEFSDWPHGSYATETIGGTRSGAVLAGAWATFMALGESGYKRLAAEVMGITDRFQQGIQNIDELRILGSPPTNKFSYTSSELPIGAIADGLERAGYFVARERAPEAIGMHAAVYHRDSVDRYLADLGDAVEQVRAGRPASGGSVAAYN